MSLKVYGTKVVNDKCISFFLSKFSQGQSVVTRVHFLLLVLDLSPLEVCDLVLQKPSLILYRFLLIGHRDLHLVKPGMQLEEKAIDKMHLAVMILLTSFSASFNSASFSLTRMTNFWRISSSLSCNEDKCDSRLWLYCSAKPCLPSLSLNPI